MVACSSLFKRKSAECEAESWGAATVSPLDYTVRISNGSSAGSGFVVSEDGFVVTNAHVVSFARAGTVQVMFSDGTKYSGTIHGSDSISDLALIKINGAGNSSFRVANLGTSSTLRPGEPITAVGAPHHLQNTISQGTVCAPLRHEYEIDLPTRYEAYIQTDVSTNPGSSGGPLLNQQGEVIGVHCRKHAGGWGLAIPVDRAKQVIEQLRANKKVVRPYYGMGLEDQVRGSEHNSVVVVSDVSPGSPVHACGLRR
jgi:S1-C subfamily serine protease